MDSVDYDIAWTRDADKLGGLIKLSKDVEFLSSKLYATLGRASPDNAMSRFWLEMSAEELSHMNFWGKAQEFAEQDLLPQIFDDPDAVAEEILGVRRQAEEFLACAEKSAASIKTADALLLALRMELCNINSVLTPLLKFIKPFLGGPCPYDSYDKHLKSFIGMYCSQETDEKRQEPHLLGDMLLRLWNDNLRLAQQSNTDELTGLLNRRGFANAAIPVVGLAQRNMETLGVIMADVDHFKDVNDKCGHQKGDQVLRHIAETMRQALRGADILSRYGGDEFIAICPNIKEGSLSAIAERIRASVETGGREVPCPVTISLGGVEGAPPSGVNASECVAILGRRADELLIRAKTDGRNKSVCEAQQFQIRL